MTEGGPVRGEQNADHQRFLAIPYAAPPTGPLRWRAPQPAAAWEGVRNALQPSPACLQAPGGTGAKRLSEDCLYLDIVAPSGAREAARPVMVWIHGGGFYGGSAGDYDARRLATQGDVVVVAVNYRLGPFGFIAFPGLEHSGEFGLLDQQAALRWIQRNIAAFGGDPGNITLFGESAGAMSISAHLVSPGAAGLFHKAILQSGSCLQQWPRGMISPGGDAFDQFLPVAEAMRRGQMAAESHGGGPTAVDELRGMPAQDVLKVFTTGRPTYGGEVLPEAPAAAWAAGRVHAMPLIWGSTRDEWRAVAGMFARETPFTDELYARFLDEAFGPQAAEVAAAYPARAHGGAAYAWGAVATDCAWTWPTLRSVRLASRQAPVFHYLFADPQAPNPAFPLAPGFKLGAAHATELASLFDLQGQPAAFSADQQSLAQTLIGYWSNFARTGDPGGPGLPDWPAFAGPEDRTALALAPGDEGIGPVDIWINHQAALWERLLAPR
jgi:para-nitrobenzyl esterase